MDNQRLFTWGLFGLLVFMTWNAWQLDYARPAQVPTDPVDTAAPLDAADGLPEMPAADLPEPSRIDAGMAPAASPETAGSQPSGGQRIRVRTDVLDIVIDTRGGDIVAARLPVYPVRKDAPDEVIELLSDEDLEFGRFQTGLRSRVEDEEPNHLALFTAAATDYRLGDAEELVIPLSWERADGLSVVKTYRFTRGSYRIDLDYLVTNGSEESWRAANYTRIVKTAHLPDRSMFDVDTYSFQGPVLYNGDKYQKYPIDDLADDGAVRFEASNGWLAAIEHHFLVAAVPPPDAVSRYDLALRNDRFVASAIGPARAVLPGQTQAFGETLFVGPKLQSQLEEISPDLKLTVDYGILTVLAQPLFWLLAKVHNVVGNWGWAIIIVTLLIKLAFYRLTARSGRSMAKMRELQPRLKQIQERYKDDRQKLSQAMMDLYKREKVNPAAGCLPILVQMPFFLAFYWVLLESVEMRQAPFMLWINDLSVRDPYFVLPLLMGVAMFFQQKLNPAPADPVQARVMQILPVVFTAFFAFFPAGLVLYWFTNTLLSILQQWRINEVVHAEATQKKKSA